MHPIERADHGSQDRNLTNPVGVIAGLGAAIPSNVLTNDTLESRIGKSDEWIRQRTGIRERRIAVPGESTASLAIRAGRAALESAGVDHVDAVIVSTTTPDRICPATAPEVAWSLGFPGACAFDVNAVCSGFVYGLATANSLIVAGVAERVLLIGADTFSTIVDPLDRATAIIFGDGAGAVVLRSGGAHESGVVGSFDLGSDGANSDLASVATGGSRQPVHRATQNGDRYLAMDGRAMYQNAVTRMTESVGTVLRQSGWNLSDVDWLVAHQANLRIIKAVAERLGLPIDRAIVNIDRFGNTAAASIPLALSDAVAHGALRPGQKVLMTAFGGGLTWGSASLIWPNIDKSSVAPIT